MAVEYERLQLGVCVSLRRRHLLDDGFQHVFDVKVVLGADAENVGGGHGQQVFDILCDLVGHCRHQVDLVKDGNDGQVKFHRGEQMCDGLGLDALGSVDDEDGSLAGLEGALDFVGEIDVARVCR